MGVVGITARCISWLARAMTKAKRWSQWLVSMVKSAADHVGQGQTDRLRLGPPEPVA